MVKDVLNRTRAAYGLSDGPSREDVAGETAGLGLGRDRVAPLTGDETKEARNVNFGWPGRTGGQGSQAGSFSTDSWTGGTAGAGGVYYPPGSLGGGSGGGRRRHRPSGGGGSGGRRSNGSGAQSQQDTDSGSAERDIPVNYTTGYKQEPTYTPQAPGADLRRTDTAGNPIGPAMDEPVPEGQHNLNRVGSTPAAVALAS
jgi:hypothetical protein